MEKIQLDPKKNGPLVKPAAVIGVGKWDDANLITLAYVGKVCADPCIMVIGIRPTRHSYSLLENHPEFVINLPSNSPAQQYAMDYCGTRTGLKTDKWADLKLTKVKGTKVKVPLIQEFPWNIECKVVKRVELGTHVCYFGEVLAIHADKETLKKNRLDKEKMNQIAYIAGSYYKFSVPPDNPQGFSLKMKKTP